MQSDYLQHSAKGSSWKTHKYIRKDGKKYYYKESKTTEGVTMDKYESESGDVIYKNAGFKYDPKRYDRSDFAKDVEGDLKEENEEEEKEKQKEKEKKYFVKHSDEDFLEHSAKGSTWKKHKYFEKIGEGAKAKYKYAKDKLASNKNGFYEKSGMKARDEYYEADKNAKQLEKRAQWDRDWVESIKDWEKQTAKDMFGKDIPRPKKVQVMKDLSGQMVDGDTLANVSKEQAKGARRTASEKKKLYRKTPLGKVDSAVERGQAIIDKLFGR